MGAKLIEGRLLLDINGWLVCQLGKTETAFPEFHPLHGSELWLAKGKFLQDSGKGSLGVITRSFTVVRCSDRIDTEILRVLACPHFLYIQLLLLTEG